MEQESIERCHERVMKHLRERRALAVFDSFETVASGRCLGDDGRRAGAGGVARVTGEMGGARAISLKILSWAFFYETKIKYWATKVWLQRGTV